jgi:hypothetical protein
MLATGSSWYDIHDNIMWKASGWKMDFGGTSNTESISRLRCLACISGRALCCTNTIDCLVFVTILTPR